MMSNPSFGYVDPLTTVPDAYRPRWKLFLERLRQISQSKISSDAGRGPLLTERNLREFFNPDLDPDEIYDATKMYGERIDVTKIEQWIRGLP
jgi:hypothetical protein